MKKSVISFIIFVVTGVHLFAQSPTVQDCLGAIPVCQNVYSDNTIYSGTGNIYPEVNTTNSCIYSEKNTVWYYLIAQTFGNLSFIITPNDSSNDYDWAVYNITNALCSDILIQPNLQVSCNSSGSYDYNGPTGASSAMGGNGNCNGPGGGSPFNQDISVFTGNAYAILITAWTDSAKGYTIDFSSSTANILDNLSPQIKKITSNVSAGDTALTIEFTEGILCSTIAPCDLFLTGPGGPYVINSVNSSCSGVDSVSKTFTITFTPPIDSTGNFSVGLDATFCNSVTDRCGNVATSGGTGIKEFSSDAAFSIFPNPATKELYINIQNSKMGHYMIYNSIGTLIKEGEIKNRETKIDVSGLVKGLYLLKVASADKIMMKKFVKE